MNSKCYLYSILFTRYGESYCAAPFVASDDEAARKAIISALFEEFKEVPFELKENPDCLICIGSFDFMKKKVRGLKEPRVVCNLSDLDLLNDGGYDNA